MTQDQKTFLTFIETCKSRFRLRDQSHWNLDKEGFPNNTRDISTSCQIVADACTAGRNSDAQPENDCCCSRPDAVCCVATLRIVWKML